MEDKQVKSLDTYLVIDYETTIRCPIGSNKASPFWKNVASPNYIVYEAIKVGNAKDGSVYRFYESGGVNQVYANEYDVLPSADDVKLIGAGHTRTIIKKGFNGDLVNFGYYFHARDLKFDGNNGTYTGGCFVQNGSVQRGFHLERIRLADFEGPCVTSESLAAWSWNGVRAEDCDDYVWAAGIGTDSDGCRYGSVIASETRACKGWLNVTPGGTFRVADLQMRVQLCTEHAYRIEGIFQNCKIGGQINANDGSAIWVDATDGHIIQGTLDAGISSNCQDTTAFVADYGGSTPGQMFFANGSNYSMLSIYGGSQCVSSPVGVNAMTAPGNDVIIHALGGQQTGVWSGGYVFVLTYYQSSGADLTGTADAVVFNVRTSGSELAYLEDGVGRRGYIGTAVQVVNFASSPYVLERWQENIAVDCTAGAVSVTLPDAATSSGQRLNIIKIDSSGNAVTVNRAGGDKINGANSFTLSAQWDAAVIYASDNANWYRVS